MFSGRFQGSGVCDSRGSKGLEFRMKLRIQGSKVRSYRISVV